MKKFSECHFELSHMQSRLILHKNDIKKLKEKNKEQVLQNICGFSALINKDIQVFKDLRKIIKDNI
ncbi:MAG: hypothetical protein U5N56_07915 [Candidatus Marinimicrobia bacterium]|nr:hypothetical protein [Candidatus Neomarinimicrobiota bacterium]